ncbi:MAG: FliA/WhiG family RNA polymerase sigma factor [Trichloromonadaceae bacterium]
MHLTLGYPSVPVDDRDRLIRDHLPLVQFLSERMVTQVPGYMTRDDITSAAMHGLVDAAGRFEAGRGVLFKTFAEVRIRGAIFDEARRMDPFSRTLRDKQGRICQVAEDLERQLGRPAEEAELAAALGMSLEAYRQLLAEVSHLGCVSLDEVLDDSPNGRSLLDSLADPQGKSPLEILEASELARDMAGLLEKLSEKERQVIALYYYEELAQKEIAEVLGVTEGRVSQLHSQALIKLKGSFNRARKQPRARLY